MAEVMPVLMIAFWVVLAIIHVAFAIAVAADSGRLVESGAGTVFVGRIVWSVATLLGGMLVAASRTGPCTIRGSDESTQTSPYQDHVAPTQELQVDRAGAPGVLTRDVRVTSNGE
jgi:hypothetical protein